MPRQTSGSIDMSGWFEDSAGDSFSLSMTSGPSWASVSGSTLNLSTPNVTGPKGASITENVTISATDQSGASSSITFAVQVNK
ncbi:hypothetical protein [Limibacillus halophilus]|uniref:Uncharacterized protein n=1 Tax=Limibacillus halophilus TaxID=1579333 RepID=A0A839SRI4_9PROT|nr:hypothetical protein [Limibacillus halophilus]MBB3065391.1 hypothetical protein [Limibacillus halophilus]